MRCAQSMGLCALGLGLLLISSPAALGNLGSPPVNVRSHGSPQAVRVGSQGGGETVCVVCVVVVALVEQLTEIRNSTVDKEVEKFCELFPKGKVRSACDAIILAYGPEVIRLLGECPLPSGLPRMRSTRSG